MAEKETGEGSTLINDSFVAGFFGTFGALAAAGTVAGALALTDAACGTAIMPQGSQTVQGDECSSDDDCWRTEECEHGYCVEK